MRFSTFRDLPHRNRCAFQAIAVALAFFTAAPARAGQPVTKTAPGGFPFGKGDRELQVLSGMYLSVAPGSSNRPTINYTLSSVRLGIMLNDVGGSGVFRGNFEFLLEAFGGAVITDAGNALGGATLQLRYNFVQPGAKWVPYFQIGGGGVYSDIHTDRSQRLIGLPVEFDLLASAGVRYMFRDRWALSVEGGYRHISNANLGKRNVGLNSLGVQIGFSYFFGR